MFEIKRYTTGCETEWNDFVCRSKNGTFLINRRYMDYHSDRFKDFSLMFFKDERLYALLPANIKDGTLYSHQGLTYGGLIMGIDTTAAATVVLFKELNTYLRAWGVRTVIYKSVPWIYHKVPAQEDLYAIFSVCNARLSMRDISSTIINSNPVKWRRDRHYGSNKARNNGITVERSADFAVFWDVLNFNLGTKYGVKPVHTLDEIRLLQSRFPENIILYVARLNGDVLGGTVLYITDQVVHAQYISATPDGKRLHAIDAIYNKVLNEDFADFRFYFDFGKSTEDGGRILNESLIYQKEGFGARGVCYDTYEWNL